VKITDVKCALFGESPVVRIVTDTGISGYGQVEWSKPYVKDLILSHRPALIGEDPTNVEGVMRKIRQRGGFKPFGSAISAIEMALWDTAGKAADIPVYKLLGGKVRDKVRVYNGSVRTPLVDHSPAGLAKHVKEMASTPERFTIVKEKVAFHDNAPKQIPDFSYGDEARVSYNYSDRGLLTEKGLNYMVESVAAMKDALGDSVGLALDCGPGWTVSDAIRFAKAVEPYHVLWLEDLVTGDYNPYVMADLHREISRATSTPIHTGEQIYLRQNFRELIETRAVSVIGPDPADVGGIAELKWIAEYADLHGVLMAPHGTNNGLLGMAALVQVCSTLPDNYIAFEYPSGKEPWWHEIVDWVPDPIVKGGFIDVWDRPGIGINFIPEAAREYLSEEDRGYFD
jgi:L-alanine-DL-glutamate epimerase-like enolase superfamily enzyme